MSKLYICTNCGDKCILVSNEMYYKPTYCPYDGEEDWEEVKNNDETEKQEKPK